MLGTAAQAAGDGLKNSADPANIAKEIITKAITKGKDLSGTNK